MRLTDTPALEMSPTWAPDGGALAFLRYEAGKPCAIYLVPASGGAARKLTPCTSFDGHTWEADGQSLIFSSNRSGRFELWRVLVSEGTLQRTRVGDLHAHRPNLVPGQHRLVYMQASFDVNIWIRPLTEDAHQGMAPAPLIASTQWEAHPQFDPMADRIAFTSNRSGSYEIWLGDRGGEQFIQAT